MSLSDDSPILVTGAAGFLGKEIVTRLVAQGRRVRALIRTGRPSPFSTAERLEIHSGDMRDKESLRAATRHAVAVVHLAARTGDQADSQEVNVNGARHLVEACQAEGCERVINMSTLSTKIPRKGIYARTKKEADEVFHASGLHVTSLLPSIVYGPEGGGVFGTLLKFIRKLPVVPVLGDGQWRSAPVYIGDVADAVIACLDHPGTAGRAYDIAGPDEIRFDDLMDRLGGELGFRPRKFHVPFRVALLAARVAATILSRPPITVSNVLGSNQNTSIDIGPARRDFGFDPLDLETGIKVVLGKIPDPRGLSMRNGAGRRDQ